MTSSSFRCLLDRQFSRFLALENAASVKANQTILVPDIGSVAGEAAGRGEFASSPFLNKCAGAQAAARAAPDGYTLFFANASAFIANLRKHSAR